MMKILFAILFVSVVSQAQTPDEIVQKFREAAIQKLNEAKDRGISEIDGVPLDELLEAAKTRPVHYAPNYSVRIGHRSCAAWQEHTGAIRLNKACANMTAESVAGISIHEFSGLAKKRDLNYELTSELLTNKSGKPLISSAQALKIQQIKLRNNLSRTSGGSTVVGGGGDLADLNFKVAGLNYLNRFSDESMLLGIPVYLLKITVKLMSVASGNTSGLFELRAAGAEVARAGPVIYVNKDKFRDEDQVRLGILALFAARLYLTYVPDNLDIASLDPQSGRWVSSLLQQPYLVIDASKKVIWENPEITSLLSQEEQKDALARAYDLGKAQPKQMDYRALTIAEQKIVAHESEP